ncbi:MAG: SAM-dependent methyltransferase [Bacteroidetes bacterium]|nr:SAM-dependent methyltransferase [Bacteroidota bacterium]MBU1374202.1 SAM-dependent methyltransferase [Bacteroidota bacterium]MBU1485914.1 SAM-dependent methyltransferase [Bacteroidota bacterium]MBU1760033.1 SAM-dependent methyltransferase [Bacteroidota bacterium]MBU2269353.1 SAM-dependent methyltransferase [Bacteroidota bacterium]
MIKGILYLIPVVMAEGAEEKSLTPYLSNTINHLKEYIVENEKTARRCLKNAGLKTPQSELMIHDYGKHQRDGSLSEYFEGLEAGNDVGLMSEAGCPGVADPGADIVAEAHKRNIKVIPLVGPSSILLALMGSGFNGQSFAFHGYIPIDKMARIKRIKELEGFSERFKQTQLFIETPFRNNPLFTDILASCKNDTKLCVACNLTAEDELIQTKSIGDWKKEKIDLHKKPAIFLLQRSR